MTQKIFFLSFLVFVFSCSNRQDNHNKNILADTANVVNYENQIDSLDLDTADFITTNFPDTIRNILYGTSDTLLNYIKISSILNAEKKNVLLGDTLSKLLNQNGFDIDNSKKKIVARKKLFNKRELIIWSNNKSDTITTQVIYWYLGKKYILIGQRWNE